MKSSIVLLACLMLISLSACVQGGFNSAQNINRLSPDMSYDQVVALLGNPQSTALVKGKLIATFWLHQAWKGNVPYDLTFDARSKKLISWAENKEKYEQRQAQWKQILTPATSDSNAPAGTAGPSDPNLMQQFAGYWYSFSSAGVGLTGGTERKLMLCPDGRYFDSAESGYSGSGGANWGTASQGSGGGRWAIQGNLNRGTITFSSGNGTDRVKYSRCGNDCVYFGSIKFAYAGPPRCR